MINPLSVIFFVTVVYSMKNGFFVDQRDFSYIVSVVAGKMYICSGVIIDEKHVLTIAHVVESLLFSNLGVIAGKTSFQAHRNDPYDVRALYIHPAFGIRHAGPEDTYYDNDIALLKIAPIFYWNPRFSRVPLDSADYTGNDALNCVIISWQVPIDRRKSISLAWEIVKVMARNEADQQWTQYLGEHDKFVVDLFGSAAISEGDIGSPILCGNFVRGFIVHGERLTIPEKPSIMVSVTPYMEFIREIIHEGLYETNPWRYSYIASIWSGDKHICGGFVLDATHIGTAAHCLSKNESALYEVIVGYPSQFSQSLSIDHITVHPGYELRSTVESPTWYINHDFAIITIKGIIPPFGRIRPLLLPESDDLREGKMCDLLRWRKKENARDEEIFLKISKVVLMNRCDREPLDLSNESPLATFWGRTQYLMPIAATGDIGNPIICDGNPIGFLVQAIPIHGEFTARTAKFLRFRPYMAFISNVLNG